MNFSISGGGIGFLGGWILFGAVGIALTIAVTLVVRLIRGRDDTPAEPGDRAGPDDTVV